MVLFPLRVPFGAAAYVIPLPMAHTYADKRGYPTAEAIEKCMTAATVMALDHTRSTIHGILTAILDNIEDLVRMPPEPTFSEKAAKAIGEASFMINGDKVAEQQITVPRVH